MNVKRQAFAALMVLLFAEVAADPLPPQSAEFSTASGSTAAAVQADLDRYFFAAARTGETSVLQTFLQAGYPVNNKNEASYTALMIAAYQGQAAAVDILLSAGADACIRDKRGHTALMGAMIKAEWQIARRLYAVNCDEDNQAQATDPITDKSQMTAAQFAEQFGQSEKFKMLSEQLQPQAQPTAATARTGEP